MRILLFGRTGQVGSELQRALAPLGELLAPDHAAVDLENPPALQAAIRDASPDVIVNAAAYTAVDAAESDPARAQRVNGDALTVMAAEAARRGTWLVHYSTDYVFDGAKTEPYREDDAPRPLSVYGRTKLAGEEAVREAARRYFIFRTSWVYGSRGANFAKTMLRLARERDELRVVADQVGAPTPAAWIADATAAVLGRPFAASGLWHLTAAGQASWHAFAEAIVQGAFERGLIERVPRVAPIATSEYPTPAARPAYSVLDNARLERDFGLAAPDWRSGLAGVLDGLARVDASPGRNS